MGVNPASTLDGAHVGTGFTPVRAETSRRNLGRSFPPGSEWLYAKLYTGTAAAHQVLRDVVGSVARKAMTSRAADRWFFIRHGDPDHHLRLRIHGAPENLRRTVWPALHAAVAPMLADGRVRRVTLDTYERDVERYGGPYGIELAEALFHADSEAVLEIVELLDPGGAGLDERWRLALCGVDRLLADLAALLGASPDGDHPLAPGLKLLAHRSQRLRPVAAELAARAAAGRLTLALQEIARSLLHMHANRLLRSAHREHELVLYDLLARLYAAESHRSIPSSTGS